MRLLVVAGECGRARSLVRGLLETGHECELLVGTDQLTEAVRHNCPQALVLESERAVGALPRHLARARAAAEAMLPAVLVTEEPAWLHVPLPAALQPCTVVAAHEAAQMLPNALAQLLPDALLPRTAASFAFRPETREVVSPAGSGSLTASEASVLKTLLATPSAVVSTQQLAAVLWGSKQVDRYERAAIRTHVYTLRAKLRALGLRRAIETLPGIGYRLRPAATAEDQR